MDDLDARLRAAYWSLTEPSDLEASERAIAAAIRAANRRPRRGIAARLAVVAAVLVVAVAGGSVVLIGRPVPTTRPSEAPAPGHVFVITASAICIGHRAGHLLFNDPPQYTGAPEGGDMPAIGTLGASVNATTTFDGWGTIHLLDAKTLEEIDNYSIPEAIDPAYASGFGTMSVHEVATDKAEDLGYLSWYDAGIRVIRFGADGIEEVGHYVDANGNDFWGVQAHRLPGDLTETPYILGSDRDSGLWIFRYTGD